MELPEPVFPQYPERLGDPGPETPPERRHWNREEIYRKMRGWLFPYIRSRVLPGDFHPITAYLFLEYKCNVDCWYCWAFNNKVKGMTEDVARRSIDWLHDHGCRVLALMGGEPLLRPQFAHKVVSYAAKKGFWIYIGTNGRLLRPEVAARLADAGTAVFNFALDSWNLQPSLPKAVEPARKNLDYLLRKQYVYGYMVFFNRNICRNNLEDVRKITENTFAAAAGGVPSRVSGREHILQKLIDALGFGSLDKSRVALFGSEFAQVAEQLSTNERCDGLPKANALFE